MKYLILLISLIFLISSASAELEQHAGFPVNAGYELNARLVLQDIDGEGTIEIIAAPENRMVKVFDHSGALEWEAVGGASMQDYARVPVVADFNGDERLEILSYGNPGWSNSTFYLWDSNGNNKKETLIGNYVMISSPSMTKERLIIAGTAPGYSSSSITNATGVRVFNNEIIELPYLELGTSVNFRSEIPYGDLDGDGLDDAVILTHNIGQAYPVDGKVWFIKLTGENITKLREGIDLGGDAKSAAVSDLNNDGINEVIVISSSGVFIFDNVGNVLYSFAIKANGAPPSVGDLEGDGINEVIMASSEDKKIYIISNGSSREFFADRVTSNLALGDINNDGKLEITAGDLYGNLVVWDQIGNVLEKRNIAARYYFFTSAAIADIEGDGNKEIILGNRNGNIYAYTYLGEHRDITPPVTIDNADGLWHNSNVAVILNAIDSESGVAATYYTIDGSLPSRDSESGNTIHVTDDGIYILKYFSIDRAGNIEDVKTSLNQVKIDKLSPSTSDDADDLWHNNSVIVKLNSIDTGSGINNTYYTSDGSVPTIDSPAGTDIAVSTEGYHSIHYFSTDNAGNIEPVRETIIKLDLTAPTTTGDSDNEWHNDDVTFILSSFDDLSGPGYLFYKVDGIPYVSNVPMIQQIFTEEGIHEIEYHSVDNASNAEVSRSAHVRIDRTPPVTSDNADSAWYNDSVTVILTAYDNLSGINSTYYRITTGSATFIESFFLWLNSILGFAPNESLEGMTVSIHDEGLFYVRYYTTDIAGNIETERISDLVKIDKTVPVITVNVPEYKTYLHSDIIGVSFESNDALSGIRAMNSIVDGTWPVSNGQTLNMLDLGFGYHEFSISSSDNAGNSKSQKVIFNVIATIDSLKILTERGSSNGWITNNDVANKLKARVNLAGQSIAAGQNKTAQNTLESYIKDIEAQTGKHITPEGANILIPEARYVIDSLQAVVSSKSSNGHPEKSEK